MADKQSLEKQLITQRLLVDSLEKSLEFARADLATISAALAAPKPQPDKSLQRELTCAGCREPIAVGESAVYIVAGDGPEAGFGDSFVKKPIHLSDSCLNSLRRPLGLITQLKQSLTAPDFRDPAPCKNCGRELLVERRGKTVKYCGRRCKQQFENRSRKAG